MTEENTTLEPTELDTLKARADMMGIKYHPKTGVEKLRAKIDNALGESNEKKEVQEAKEVKMLTHKEFKKLKLAERKRNAAKLIRVNITCMNPEKKNWEGEIISVGSAKLGTFKKFIPFNTTDGWHVPHIIYEALKERKCSVFQTVKDHLGQKIRKAKLVPEFSIEVLPPLSKEELKDLAQRQAQAGSID